MFRFLLLLPALVLGACETPQPSPYMETMDWRHEDGLDASYLLAPGDEIEVVVHSAPELSRTVTINPDGRFRMPFTGPILAAARTLEQVKSNTSQALTSELRDPDVDVFLVEASSQQIFVGGAVENPGLFELPGLIDPLQAVIMAGDVTDAGRDDQVILMRRLPGGQVQSAIFDLKAGINNAELATWTPLRRFDVVYVTRKRIADQNLFVQQFIRNALPVDFSIFYDIGGDSR
ncbi:MAG: polysaccharide biosynthesis/export family protein [Henriciella sp.]|nr:polysaccharide biosynthesis/export family protein [Henriciella sp.]